MLNRDPAYALCEVAPARIRHPNRAKRQRFPVCAWRFREARLTAGMGVGACADLLRVSERTIRNWEAGAVRIPYASYKLLRVLRGGRYLADPIWRDYRVVRETLITPEGHRFHAGDLAWWSLLIRRARAFSDLCRHARQSATSEAPAKLGEARPGAVERAAQDPPPLAQVSGVGVASEPCSPSLPGCSTAPENRRFGLPPSNRGVSETERNGLLLAKPAPRAALGLDSRPAACSPFDCGKPCEEADLDAFGRVVDCPFQACQFVAGGAP